MDLVEIGPLVASIRTWITNWNDQPRPFVWHKSADEILDNLAAYCTRISNSGHQMVDRLMPVGDEGAGWPTELPVEMDGGGEREDV